VIQFLTAKNLKVPTLALGDPWKFSTTPEALEAMRKLPKPVRRKKLLDPATDWQVYSAIKGVILSDRISKTNPPGTAYGIVVDYDKVADLDSVIELMMQMPESQRPNYVEVTLSKKIRLVWLFEKPILIPSPAFFEEMMIEFFKTLEVPTLMAGYDSASLKHTEMWTNGGEWYECNTVPLSWDFCFGVICGVSKKASLFENGEVPLDMIAAEMVKRWPGRWQGDFVLDSLGVRFWDETADNPTGCQVKPDGMLCYTGKEPFVKWSTLFGVTWYEEQRVLNLGRAASDIFFDGKVYWETRGDRREDSSRVDIMLRLAGRGLSGKMAKGATQSDIERVLDHIQQVNRVQGAAPLINYPKGIVNYKGRRILNTADLNPVQPVPGPAGNLELDCPFIYHFLLGFFPRPELMPREHFEAWLQRAYRMVLQYQRFMGQAVFVCGPRNNGKTLLCMRIVAPLLGGRTANPINYMAGDTTFNSELFSTALLAINDEDAPSGEAERRKMLAKLKGLVVNPFHTYNAKFEKATEIEWIGRLFITLNDDPGSVGMLMEVEENTRDKQMFFASQPYAGVFPRQDILEAKISVELPYYAHHLLNWEPPKEVLSDDRMGIKSYFDPRIIELSHQQTFASNLNELVKVWIRTDAYWGTDVKDWDGTPTDLLSCLQGCDTTTGIARDWTQAKIVRALTSLAKQGGSGVHFMGTDGRYFKIIKPKD
jgi:uncharacterized protein DUF5906